MFYDYALAVTGVEKSRAHNVVKQSYHRSALAVEVAEAARLAVYAQLRPGKRPKDFLQRAVAPGRAPGKHRRGPSSPATARASSRIHITIGFIAQP